MSLCLDVVLSRFPLSLVSLFFLPRLRRRRRRRIEFQYHLLFHHSVFFSLPYIRPCLIIAERQPSPNRSLHEPRWFSSPCSVTIGARLPICLFSLSLRAPPAALGSYDGQHFGSEQKRLIKVRINTSLLSFPPLNVIVLVAVERNG